MEAASLILLIATLYLGAGLAFGLFFIVRGLQRFDPAAHGAPWAFRLLILPGVVALWPIVARRLARGSRSGAES